MAICVFCGLDSKLTREHVFPQWASRALLSRPDRLETAFRMRGGSTGGLNVDYETKVANVVAKAACAACNSEWMSALDAEAKTILEPMLLGYNRRLSVSRLRTLTNWAILKFMADEFGDNPKSRTTYFTAEERRDFMETRSIPKACYLWLGRYEGGEDAAGFVGIHDVPNLRAGDSEQDFSALTSVIAMGQVLFTLFAHRIPHEIADAIIVTLPDTSFEESTVPIWPIDGAKRRWPPAFAFDKMSILHFMLGWQQQPLSTRIAAN